MSAFLNYKCDTFAPTRDLGNNVKIHHWLKV